MTKLYKLKKLEWAEWDLGRYFYPSANGGWQVDRCLDNSGEFAAYPEGCFTSTHRTRTLEEAKAFVEARAAEELLRFIEDVQP